LLEGCMGSVVGCTGWSACWPPLPSGCWGCDGLASQGSILPGCHKPCCSKTDSPMTPCA
jgi:hypothetical protein